MRPAASAGTPVSVEQHLARILGTVGPLPPVEVAIGDATGLVLADEATAAVALPRFDHSAMDGYAVRAADVATACEDAPVTLPVAGTVAAGEAWTGPFPEGGAVRIMTGAPVPEGADLVVPFEWTDRGDPVSVSRAAEPGRHIRRTGGDAEAGAPVVAAGTFLRPPHLGLLASVGHGRLLVHPRPRVGIVSTGAELVPAGSTELTAGSVFDSNAVVVAAAARLAGCDVVELGPVPDDPVALRGVLTEALPDVDAVITTGGISAGDHDVVKETLAPGGEMWFGSVAVRPGRPQGFGVLDGGEGRRVPLFALPGTPVAAYLTYAVFVRPALRELAGRRRLPPLLGRLTADVVADARTRLLPGWYSAGAATPSDDPVGHRQSALTDVDALLVVPPSDRLLPAGTEVEVIRLEDE